MKNIRIIGLNFFYFLVVNFSVYLNRYVFVMSSPQHQIESQANTINKQPQNEQMVSRVNKSFPKRWQLLKLNLRSLTYIIVKGKPLESETLHNYKKKKKKRPSRKRAYIILTPLNPTFI